MKRNATRPFFLMTTYQTPHAPFQAPGDPAIRIADQPKGPPPEGNPAAYPAMVQSMDQGIGKIMATLRSLNLESKTLVFFMSDNGAVELGGSNLPLRGWKGQLYEGGHRVPAIAYWPGTIAPAASAETLATIDIFPSILELAQVAIPEGHRIDGLSFAPVLLHGEPMPPRQLFWLYKGKQSRARG
ncbi:MAG: sulfatase-like hydrolase/transferase [Rhodospirillales bacterium]|nr:sulfatase-like hydrolase/transferase [Rhodospirillales bacterium]